MVGDGCLWSRSQGPVVRPFKCTILDSVLAVNVGQFLFSEPAFNDCDLNSLSYKILLPELLRGSVLVAVVGMVRMAWRDSSHGEREAQDDKGRPHCSFRFDRSCSVHRRCPLDLG